MKKTFSSIDDILRSQQVSSIDDGKPSKKYSIKGGDSFGRLTAIKRVYEVAKSGRNAAWICKCECGNYKVVRESNLAAGMTNSCGCLLKDIDKERRVYDKDSAAAVCAWKNMITVCKPDYVNSEHYYKKGISVCRDWESFDTFNRWVAGRNRNERFSVVRKNKELGFYPQNCSIKIRQKAKYSTTRLGRIWNGMKTRCYNKKSNAYPLYGGRGVSICNEWRSSFYEFKKWALANGYSKNLSIDRIDTNGDYSPSNCRWATPKTQSNNTRKSIRVLYNGNTYTVKEAARIMDISSYQVRSSKKARLAYGFKVVRKYSGDSTGC